MFQWWCVAGLLLPRLNHVGSVMMVGVDSEKDKNDFANSKKHVLSIMTIQLIIPQIDCIRNDDNDHDNDGPIPIIATETYVFVVFCEKID